MLFGNVPPVFFSALILTSDAREPKLNENYGRVKLNLRRDDFCRSTAAVLFFILLHFFKYIFRDRSSHLIWNSKGCWNTNTRRMFSLGKCRVGGLCMILLKCGKYLKRESVMIHNIDLREQGVSFTDPNSTEKRLISDGCKVKKYC